ncbi:MAG: hypothetical protein B7Y01_05330, partial [Xanthobacter sp. 17-67-6]
MMSDHNAKAPPAALNRRRFLSAAGLGAAGLGAGAMALGATALVAKAAAGTPDPNIVPVTDWTKTL